MTLMVTDSGGDAGAATPEIEQVGSISFSVAPGDPDAIDSAASWHEQVSTQMGAHAAAITSASSQALSQWQGDAARSYADLASQMHDAFRANEVRAGDTAATMHNIAQQLADHQAEGNFAMREAQDWVQQAITDHAKATALQGELTQAQADLKSMTTSTGNDMHLGINLALNDNTPQTQAQQAKVADLQRKLTAAKKALHEDNEQIQRWDRKGQQAWEDAEDAVSRFMTIPIEPIPAPPMPGTPTFVTPPHKSFLDEAWDVIKDGAKDTIDGVWDGTKYILNHPLIIDGIAIVAMVAIPGGGMVFLLADGAMDEGAGVYQYGDGEITKQDLIDDSITNVVVAGAGAGAGKAVDGLTGVAEKAGTGSVSSTTINRIIGMPTTGLSTVWTVGQIKKNGWNPKK